MIPSEVGQQLFQAVQPKGWTVMLAPEQMFAERCHLEGWARMISWWYVPWSQNRRVRSVPASQFHLLSLASQSLLKGHRPAEWSSSTSWASAKDSNIGLERTLLNPSRGLFQPQPGRL